MLDLDYELKKEYRHPNLKIVHPQLHVGDEAPNFKLEAQDGHVIELNSFRQLKTVVLFFYPKNYSPICTLEAIAFRNSYALFKLAGAEVLGISTDPVESNLSFCNSFSLPFNILYDVNGEVRSRYYVEDLWGMMSGRSTFVIDREGLVNMIYTYHFRAKPHIEEALRLVRMLEKKEDVIGL